MQWLTSIIFAVAAILPTSNSKTTEAQHQVCHLYVEEDTTWMLDLKSSKVYFIPSSMRKDDLLYLINESYPAATEQSRDEMSKTFASFHRVRRTPDNVEIFRICVLSPINSTTILKLQANWTNQICSGEVKERNGGDDCHLPRIGLWQESAPSDFNNRSGFSPPHHSRRLWKRGSGRLSDLRPETHHRREFLNKKRKPKKQRNPMKKKNATKWSYFCQRLISQELNLGRRRPKHRRRKSKNRHSMPSIQKKKCFRLLKQSRFKPARTGQKKRRYTRSLPRDTWLEVFNICSNSENRLIYNPLSDTNRSENIEVPGIERLGNTSLSLQTKVRKSIVEIQWDGRVKEALKTQRNLTLQFRFSSSHQMADLQITSPPELYNRTVVRSRNGDPGRGKTEGPTSTGLDAANLSIILACIACSFGIVVIFCKWYKRAKKRGHAKPSAELSSDTEWTELSSDGCREVVCEQSRLPEDMTQSRSCCCAGKYKNFKPVTKSSKPSQQNADFLNQCQHQSKKSQKLRRKRDTKRCCCGKLPDHMTSESHNHLTNSKRPNDNGTIARQDQSCFSKYNGLINNPHRQEYAISPSVLSSHLPVAAQTFSRRLSKHGRGGAIESTCHKAPPNRAIIENDGQRITSVSYGEYQVTDVTGRCHLAGQRPNTGGRTSGNLPKYSREDNSAFPATNLPQYRGVAHPRNHSPPIESALLLRERTYSPQVTRGVTDDLPPEYSEPPAYSALLVEKQWR